MACMKRQPREFNTEHAASHFEIVLYRCSNTLPVPLLQQLAAIFPFIVFTVLCVEMSGVAVIVSLEVSGEAVIVFLEMSCEAAIVSLEISA